ncbi:glucosamine--fructose-6-phosphate aminotransferase [Leptolinea sp. HRD-7]|nr:glucosamine--fructose-6-phosphate aminotransferase [Leptolinea sp. HRD-7]
MSTYSEIFQQPDCLRRLFTEQRKEVEKTAAEIRRRSVNFVFLAARGTSDNAGRYANYLLGGKNGLPVALATPSLFTYYQTPPILKNALVIGISQSGQSPDIVSVIEEGRRQNCLTLAITNEPESPLACKADLVLPLLTGPELAVAATKTYTAELMVLAMLSAALAGDSPGMASLEKIPERVSDMLKIDDMIQDAVKRYRYMEQTVVLGRGFNYATAYEWALKMKEMTYISAEPYSSADFMHGPIAIVHGGFPVMAVAPEGRVFDSMMDILIRIKTDLNGELMVISNRREALDMAITPVELPDELPEWLSPIAAIVPAQLFAYHLSCIKGHDPDRPRIIHKVTETK